MNVARRSLVPFGGFVLAVACGSSSGLDRASSEDDAGAPRDASTDAPLSFDDASAPAKVVYVSAMAGKDTNDGRTPATPKRSIAAGIAAAVGVADAGVEVRVCRGSYPESGLVLSRPIALRGGYDCGTWRRSTGFVAPTFEGVIETSITNADATLQAATLTVDGAVADRSAVVEGFSIVGDAAGATAVRVDHGATPVVTNNRVLVTTHVDVPGGSTGLAIRGGASPEIAANSISATCDSFAAATALDLDSGSPHVHDNVITAGPSCGSAVGLASGGPDYLFGDGVMTEATGNAFERNFVQGAGSLNVLGAITVDVVDNQIIGSSGDQVRGLTASLLGQSRLRVSRNRIFGGRGTSSIGVKIFGRGALLANNMIHGGEGALSGAIAVLLENAPETTVAYNTIYEGTGGDPNIHGQVVLEKTQGAVFLDNIFAGSGIDDVALFDNDANVTPSTIATFSNNLVLNESLGVYATRGCAVGPCFQGVFRVYPMVADAEAFVLATDEDAGVAPRQAANNVALPDACPDAGACVGTLTSLFASFSAPPDDGFADLFGAGFRLQAGAPCAVARGGAPTAIDTDLYGTPRSTTTPSIGAHELVGACTP